MRLFLLPVILVPLSGCAAGKAMYHIMDAQRDMRELEATTAQKDAVYEYTMAREYYAKAREEAGYSDYHAAETLARKASDWANKAMSIAEYGTSERELMRREVEDLVPEEIERDEPYRSTPLNLDDDLD